MLNKLIADAALSPQSFHKIAGTAPTDPAALQERAEALAAGILSAIKSMEDFCKAHPRADLSFVEKQIDDAYDRCLGLWCDATRVKRNSGEH